MPISWCIAMLADQGVPDGEITKRISKPRENEGHWPRRFVEQRIEGPYDEARSGALRGPFPTSKPMKWSTSHSRKRLAGCDPSVFPPDVQACGSSDDDDPTEFLKFLKTVDGNLPSNLDIHLGLDNFTTHKTKRTFT